MINKIFSTSGVLLVSVFGMSQTPFKCYETHERSCELDKKSGYFMSSHSKSGTFIPGDTTEVTLTLHKNVSYRISFCSGDPNVHGKVQFQVVEFQTESMFEEVITYEEQYPEQEYTEESNGETENEEESDPYGEYEEEAPVEETYVEVEPIKVPVITKRKVYKKVPVVVFSNNEGEGGSEGGFTQEYYTISRETKTITLRVYIPGRPEEEDTKAGAKGSTVSYVCVGLLVEHQPAPKLGFK
ncbi:MAG: hypothetical protein ACLGGV_01210 [Bacteroidia bacterium]